AGAVCCPAARRVLEDEEEPAIFAHRFEAHRFSLDRELRVTGRILLIHHPENVRDGDLLWLRIRYPLRMNTPCGIGGEPFAAGEVAARFRVGIAQARACLASALDNRQRDVADLHYVGVPG